MGSKDQLGGVFSSRELLGYNYRYNHKKQEIVLFLERWKKSVLLPELKLKKDEEEHLFVGLIC